MAAPGTREPDVAGRRKAHVLFQQDQAQRQPEPSEQRVRQRAGRVRRAGIVDHVDHLVARPEPASWPALGSALGQKRHLHLHVVDPAVERHDHRAERHLGRRAEADLAERARCLEPVAVQQRHGRADGIKGALHLVVARRQVGQDVAYRPEPAQPRRKKAQEADLAARRLDLQVGAGAWLQAIRHVQQEAAAGVAAAKRVAVLRHHVGPGDAQAFPHVDRRGPAAAAQPHPAQAGGCRHQPAIEQQAGSPASDRLVDPERELVLEPVQRVPPLEGGTLQDAPEQGRLDAGRRQALRPERLDQGLAFGLHRAGGGVKRDGAAFAVDLRRYELPQGLVGRREVGHHATAARAQVVARRAGDQGLAFQDAALEAERQVAPAGQGVGGHGGPAAQQPAAGAGRVAVDVDAAGHGRPPGTVIRNRDVQSSRARSGRPSVNTNSG